MKLVLLTAIIIIIIMALVLEGQEVRRRLEPCQIRVGPQAYEVFRTRHIIMTPFNKESQEAWAGYLRDNELCGRVPRQSFIDASEQNVRAICSHAGRLVQGALASEGDYCMSRLPMTVYQVYSDIHCTVVHAVPSLQHVLVRCAMAGWYCRPIHYEDPQHRKPFMIPCRPYRVWDQSTLSSECQADDLLTSEAPFKLCSMNDSCV